MLTENDVVDAVVAHLEANGYEITSRCTTGERGIDIDAVHRGTRRRLLVEAKGETSSKVGTARHGLAFDQKQVTHHVARAFYTAVTNSEKHVGTEAAIALPDTRPHRERVARIAQTLTSLGIAVFFVGPDRRVTTLGFDHR